jgi:hypothetical protein
MISGFELTNIINMAQKTMKHKLICFGNELQLLKTQIASGNALAMTVFGY